MLFAPIDLTNPAEADRYLKLVGEFADSVEALRERVIAQAERGWRLPKPALPGSRRALEGNGSMAVAAILPAADRAVSDDTRAAITALVETRLKPAFARLIDTIGPDLREAPSEIIFRLPAKRSLSRQ